jgi:hypothetical protein
MNLDRWEVEVPLHFVDADVEMVASWLTFLAVAKTLTD